MERNPMRHKREEFENEVRRVVRRGSKSPVFEDSIKEIGTHYEDLYQELLEQGISPTESDALARKRLGSPQSIGLEILNCPERKANGIWLQKLAFLFLLLVFVQYLSLAYCSVSAIAGNHITFWYFATVFQYLSASALFGKGILQARKVLWSPVITFIPLVSFSIVIAYDGFRPILERHHASFIMSREWALAAGFQVALWIVGLFVVVGLTCALIGRIRILRCIGFRLVGR
jgi:hypothetical protein